MGVKYMLNSSIRKRALSGWLEKHSSHEFWTALKLQKFLFFYEALSKIEESSSEFRSLKGYINGPVFSDVYGDYTYRMDEFVAGVGETYQENNENVNEDRAKLAAFLVKILNEQELSDLTHEFNIWRTKKDAIENGGKHIPLSESDFTQEDVDLLNSIKEMYPTEFIESVEVIEISGKSFVISRDEYSKLTEEQKFTFFMLAEQDNLENPVYVSISEDGVLLVD
jgi:hypothetical protein